MGSDMAAKLRVAEIRSLLKELPEWTLANGKLRREYKFGDFQRAFRFMKKAAPGIDAMDHHPEWFNVYDRVTVDLSTHDAKGVTMKDFELARLLEGIAGRLR